MHKLDTLLLVSGNADHRMSLRAVFGESYHLLEAINIQQALLLLEQNISCIAAVLLDAREGEFSLPEEVPVVIFTPNEDQDLIAQGFHNGAADVIPIYYDAYAMLRRVDTIVQLHIHRRHLESLVESHSQSLRHSNDVMVDALSSIIEYRSVESGQHILRIRRFTRILLEEVQRSCPEYGLTEQTISIISSAAALHDIGKIAIPDAILTKPGPLTEEERAAMQTHALTGCHILQTISDVADREYLRYAHNICHYHHERWDGTGYPEGLSGDQIPICAQVVGLADVYDALTTKRVYKDAYPFETAVNMILNGECGTFSPKLLECFKQVAAQYEVLGRAYADGLTPQSEEFDVTLPPPAELSVNDSLEFTQAKYLALAHYLNVFLMEVDLEQGLFHLIYNPYPELSFFREVSNFFQLRQILLDQIVVPEDQKLLDRFLTHDIHNFLQDGLRRTNYFFRLRSTEDPGWIGFEVTLLRPSPIKAGQRKMSLLWRKVSHNDSTDTVTPVSRSAYMLSTGSYCCRYDQDFTLETFSADTRTLAGYTADELKTQFQNKLISLVHPEDRDMLRNAFREQLLLSNQVQLEHRIISKNGQILWVMHKGLLVTEADGREYLWSYLTDISSAKQETDALRAQLAQYEIILAQTENALFEWDISADTVQFSQTWKTLFGLPTFASHVSEVLQGGAFFHPDDIHLLTNCIQNLHAGSHYEMTEVRLATARGRYLWCRIRASALRDPQGALLKIVGIVINIDDEKQAERALQDRAERDTLTKLLNKDAGRRYAEKYLEQVPQSAPCALMILDLDNFKQVNDQYGHLFGDSILTMASRELKKLFRNQDILARIGGDEFMILMRGVSNRTLVQNRCAQLINMLHTAFHDQNCDLPLSCSIGIALSPEHGTTYYDLYKKADQALYQAKALGKSTFVFYDSKDAAFLSSKRRTTAVNNRIDSDEQPGLADSNLVQFAFQQLYGAQDMDSAINHILDLVGRQMNVSRVYIFENSSDNRCCSNTYEWCNEGILPEIQNLQGINYKEDIPGYQECYNEHGILYCPDIKNLPQQVYDIVAPQGIKSMLHCAILDKGVFRGYIGFDECQKHRLWTQEQIQMLTYFAEMLSVFLLKNRAQEKIAQRLNDMNSILDNQNAWIYIIDPESRKLKYLNAQAHLLTPDAKPGMPCYKVFMGADHPCPGCPCQYLPEQKTASAVLQNTYYGMKILSEATAIQWEGETACLVTCRKLPEEN